MGRDETSAFPRSVMSIWLLIEKVTAEVRGPPSGVEADPLNQWKTNFARPAVTSKGSPRRHAHDGEPRGRHVLSERAIWQPRGGRWPRPC